MAMSENIRSCRRIQQQQQQQQQQQEQEGKKNAVDANTKGNVTSSYVFLQGKQAATNRDSISRLVDQYLDWLNVMNNIR